VTGLDLFPVCRREKDETARCKRNEEEYSKRRKYDEEKDVRSVDSGASGICERAVLK